MQLNVKKTNQAPVLAAKGDVTVSNGGINTDLGGGGNVTVTGDLGNKSVGVTYTQTTTCC